MVDGRMPDETSTKDKKKAWEEMRLRMLMGWRRMPLTKASLEMKFISLSPVIRMPEMAQQAIVMACRAGVIESATPRCLLGFSANWKYGKRDRVEIRIQDENVATPNYAGSLLSTGAIAQLGC